MNDQALKLELITLSAGDVDKAQAMYAWITGPVPVPDAPQPQEGVILTDLEITSNTADALWSLAMARLAAKQNAPQPVAEMARG